jgi:hypothetical protein
MLHEILVPLAFFVALTIIISMTVLTPYWRRRELHKTLREAMERGQNLDLEVIHKIMEQDHRPAGISKLTLRRWSIMIAALGFARGAMILLEQGPVQNYGQAMAVIILGAGLWIAAMVPGAERQSSERANGEKLV